MRNRREDVVAAAVGVLDGHGLADLTMRRLAGDLGVRPSAIYHHFPDKQTLLGAVADEVLRRGGVPSARPDPEPVPDPTPEPVPDPTSDQGSGHVSDRVLAACRRVRDALLAHRDGAELVATARAFGLGGAAAYDEIGAAVRAVLRAGDDGNNGGPAPGSDRSRNVDPVGAHRPLVTTATRTLLHLVLGHVGEEQTYLQALSAGAIEGDPPADSDFDAAVGLVLAGLGRPDPSRGGGPARPARAQP